MREGSVLLNAVPHTADTATVRYEIDVRRVLALDRTTVNVAVRDINMLHILLIYCI